MTIGRPQRPRRNPKDQLRSSFLIRIFDDGETQLLPIWDKAQMKEIDKLHLDVEKEKRSWMDVARTLKFTTHRNKGNGKYQKLEYVLRWKTNGDHPDSRDTRFKSIENPRGRNQRIPLKICDVLRVRVFQHSQPPQIKDGITVTVNKQFRYVKRIIFVNNGTNSSRRVSYVIVNNGGMRDLAPNVPPEYAIGKGNLVVEKVLKVFTRKFNERVIKTRMHAPGRSRRRAWPIQGNKIYTAEE